MAAGATAADVSAAYVQGAVPLADWLVVAPSITCIAAAGLLMMMRKSVRHHGTIALGALILSALFIAALLVRVLEHGPVVMTMGRWLPPFGITFAADILGASFAFAASLVAAAAATHALTDVDATERRYGFFPFLMMMMAGVNGAFLTGDIFNMYVWFEVLLISSFGLVVLGSRHEQLDGAMRYAFLNLVATTIFLVTTGMIYGVFGTLNMADIARKAAQVRLEGPVFTLAALLFLAFSMKAAAFPVNAWLPASYHTPPAIVSALFAGLLTKVGIYALLRTGFTLLPMERDILAPVLAAAAAATMLAGALGALAQNDIRRMMAFLVVSGIGLMLAGLAMSGPLGLGGAVFYALHSMVAMAAAFLLVGAMQKAGGTVFLDKAGGLYARAPLLSALAFAVMLAVAGLPPFSGLWPKVMLVKAALDIGAFWLAGAILVSALLTTMVLARMFLLAFWRPSRLSPVVEAIAVPAPELAALGILVLLLLLFGLYPEPLAAMSLDAADWLLSPSRYVDAVFPPTGATP